MPLQKRIDITELSWLTADLDPLQEEYPDEAKCLKDLCLEKLVSDVCLFRNLTGMPKFIHFMLLSTALTQNRTLSISQLLKYCPYKEFILPLPLALTHWQSLVKPRHRILYDVERHMENALTVLSTFTCLIEESCETTQLEILDLGVFPWGEEVLDSLCKFILSKDPKKEKFSKTYTLKISVALAEREDARQLVDVLSAAEALGLKLLVTGLHCHNRLFPETLMLNILDKLDPSELVHFSLNYAKITPSADRFLIQLRNFQNMKFFSISYQADEFASEPHLGILADTLSELPRISRLILQGNRFRGCLNDVLQRHCKKNTLQAKKSKLEHDRCCVVHNGDLEFLDISAGRLENSDVLFLREMPLAGKLKYLNVSYNSLDGQSGFQSLLASKSSLVLLDMECAFQRNPLYSVDLFPFSTYTQLKYLNMRGLDLRRLENFPQFSAEKNKCPNLIVHRESLDQPLQQRFDFTGMELPPELFFMAPD